MDGKIRHCFRAEPSWMEFGAANTPTGLPSGAHLHTHLQPTSRRRCHSPRIGILPPSHSFLGRIGHTFSKKRVRFNPCVFMAQFSFNEFLFV